MGVAPRGDSRDRRNHIEVKTVNQEEQQKRWGAYIVEFSRQNRMRPARLGQVKAGAVMEDYWLEDGLPLAGISLETKGKDAPFVGIMLSGEGRMSGGLTHTVSRVKKLRLQITADEQDDGLEIEDTEGMTTILRFESQSDGARNPSG
jgi:hypothetical protein